MMKNVKFPVEIDLNEGKIEKFNAVDVNELNRMYVEHGMTIECRRWISCKDGD